VQVWELHANMYLHDHHVEDVLMNKMIRENPSLHAIDFAFWGHGLHDYGWWDSHPYGQRFYDTITSQWVRVRETVPVPVVWTSINPHCLALDPLAHRSFTANRPGGFAMQVLPLPCHTDYSCMHVRSLNHSQAVCDRLDAPL
jgi:hypothetical protein